MSQAIPKKVPDAYKSIINPFIVSGQLTIEQGTKHCKLVRADGHKCPVPMSPGDHRGVLNFKSQVRRFASGQAILR